MTLGNMRELGVRGLMVVLLEPELSTPGAALLMAKPGTSTGRRSFLGLG
jgi:hypothetical protein